MNKLDYVLGQIAGNLDQRRLEITHIRRVILNYVGMSLESRVVVMAIPMVYAHWEGYFKEVCQIYLEHVESAVSRRRDLQPMLLGYLWTPILKPLTGGMNTQMKKTVAESAIYSLDKPVVFEEKEKAIDTKSNLNYDVLERTTQSICLDITPLTPRKRHLNALVNLRNNIAHGSSPRTLTYQDFHAHASETMKLMEQFEQILVSALRARGFCTN